MNSNNKLQADSNNLSYAQASKKDIKNIIKIKDAFPKLPSNKIIEIHNIINNKKIKRGKPKINITTKDFSRKQIIISISTNNSEVIITQANVHITNINKLLKNVKYNISANYICSNNKRIVITTNKAVASSNLNIVERYIKELDNIDSNNVMSFYLPQSKSYLKVLEVSYFLKNINLLIISNMIEMIIKKAYIFNNIVLVSYSHVIKAFPKLDMTVIWIDIWDSQNSIKVKGLINRYFNVSYNIIAMRETHMNLEDS